MREERKASRYECDVCRRVQEAAQDTEEHRAMRDAWARLDMQTAGGTYLHVAVDLCPHCRDNIFGIVGSPIKRPEILDEKA